jgi:hypothetical protein
MPRSTSWRVSTPTTWPSCSTGSRFTCGRTQAHCRARYLRLLMLAAAVAVWRRGLVYQGLQAAAVKQTSG